MAALPPAELPANQALAIELSRIETRIAVFAISNGDQRRIGRICANDIAEIANTHSIQGPIRSIA